MKLTRKVAALLFYSVLLVTPAVAQRRQPANFPTPTTQLPAHDPTIRRENAATGAPGRYQLPDGTWHEAMVYDWKPDRVYMAEAGKSVSVAVSPEQIKRFTTRGETYASVAGFRLRRRQRLVRPAFARELFAAGGYTLFQYEAPDQSFWSRLFSQHLLLRIHNESIVVLPTKLRPFTQHMLAIVGDDPALAAQLRSGKFRRPWQDAPAILTAYISYKSQLPKNSADQ